MLRLTGPVVSSLLLATLFAHSAAAQAVVYNNQANLSNGTISSFTNSTEWDDVTIVGGGLLRELSLLVVPGSVPPPHLSGFFDLRLFNDNGNYPQGELLGTIPFSDTFPIVPAGLFSDSVLISMTNLDSLGIMLPHNARLGVGLNISTSVGLIPSGPPSVGSSPGGNWAGSSHTERFEFGGGLPYRLVVADPEPSGPGVGSYNVFETALATPNGPGGSSGIGADEDFFTGIRFRVERTTHLSQVGGYMSGTGTIFAAIVQTDSLFALPNPRDLSGDDVLATTLLEMPGLLNHQDVVGDIDVTLEPGTYALMFGSGKFGAEGDGYIRGEHIPNGDWSELTIRQSDGLAITQIGVTRMFAVADSAPGTLQVRPTFDVLGEVTTDGSGNVESVRLIDGDPKIIVDSNDSPEPDEYAVLEFSLADVPLDRDITRITLEFKADLLTHSGPLQIDVFGYAGDGAAQRTDVLGSHTVVGQTNFDDLSGLLTVDIDPAFVTGLLGQASHLGLTFAPDETGNFRFHTLESGEFGEPPLLTITLGPPPVTTVLGDYNGDVVVNSADYTVWRDAMTAGATELLNDPTPGTVDESDFVYWRNHFGDELVEELGAGSAAAVPEPGSLALLCLALPALVARRRMMCDV